MLRRLLLALSVSVAAPCGAQIDLLTITESQEILEKLPAFKSSEARGECPGFGTLDRALSRHSSLELRGNCPPDGFAGSMMIDNFTVDRLTGAVTSWPSGRPVDGPPEMMALARRLVVQARARALSQEEAACVARQAARDEWGPDVPSSVVRNDPPGGPEILFVARHALVATGATAEWNVSVDTSSPAVLEVNGRTIDSTGVAALLSRMRAVRASPSLSGAEALAVAVRVPSIVARISAKCSLLSADFGTANRRFISLEDTCKEHPRELQVVGAVNVRTGAVTDPRTQKALDTPESVHLARELLHRAEARRAEVMAEIDRACR